MSVAEKIFYAIISGFVAGVLLHSFLALNISAVLFLLLISLALLFIDKLSAGSLSDGFRPLPIAAIFLAAVSLGIVRFEISDAALNKAAIQNFAGRNYNFEGIISGEPDVREESNRLAVDLKAVSVGTTTVPIFGKILAVTSIYPEFKFGDRLKLFGTLKQPENFSNDAGREFDYRGFLEKEGISFQMFRPQITKVGEDEGGRIKSFLLNFKGRLTENIGREIPEPDASLLDGLLFGSKRSLGQTLLDDFRRAGVIHVVVLSGYNITIVAESVTKFFAFLPGMIGPAFGVASIILFAIMTGGSATIVRASIMALLVILARTLGRNYDITRALIIAGVFMILQNPRVLVFDPSFQLSFAATVAIIYVSPLVRERLSFVTEKFGFRDIVSATLSTQIFVLPMILYMMGQLSIVALPVNLLILPFVPATMLFGFLTSIFGFLGGFLSAPFGLAAYLLLHYELKIVDFFSHLPFAAVSVSNFPLIAVVGIYLIYGVALIFLHRKFSRGEREDLK